MTVAAKSPFDAAFRGTTAHARESASTSVPVRMREHFDHRTVPQNALRHAPDVYVWEQDGCLAHVRMDGTGAYEYQFTALPADPVAQRTLRYFVLEKGMSPREGWRIYTKQWEETYRAVLGTFALTLSADDASRGRPRRERKSRARTAEGVRRRIVAQLNQLRGKP